MPPAPENNKYNGDETCDRFEIILYLRDTHCTGNGSHGKLYWWNRTAGSMYRWIIVGKQGLPELPVLGLRFLMPTAAERLYLRRFVRRDLSGPYGRRDPRCV